MYLAAHELPPLMGEYHTLMRHFGQTQMRCDALVRAQAAQIACLQGQAMRLRAALIVRDTALAWERAQRMDALAVHMQRLARERLQWQWRAASAAAEAAPPGAAADDPAACAASFAAADLLICQTGCLSHGDHWRVQDQCRRTGKACVLVEPAAAHVAGCEPSEAPQSLVEWKPAPEGTTP
ncbi:MAG: DUF2325 domain-containing protein [Comamonas sp.]